MVSKKAQSATKKHATKKPVAKKVASKKSAPKPKNISEDDIRKRAQEIYEERIAKGIVGNSESDWLQAEKELI